ncbi:cobalt transport protein [Methanolacinia petrolearia DSM 11571]|uniref:Cobalt transport protein n=1 Tax=Methanolacinia petrolearia (strain DSM 11571 / OCM 486 / SEBR 4847) TaxID=679926 RepID=E1RHS5_METP4|nr:energy-coupling factor transporter transmembrane component T [Methanolacinia petrolearia]ADN36463.1 cobalt transport protein [Methanolacinia petrolearia DSM 11571]
MKDPRIRMASMIMLSCAAFAGMEAALASVLWVLVFSDRKFKVPSLPAFLGLFVIISVIAILSIGDASGGLSYFVRMSALIVIAVWAYSAIRPGEILDTLVWLFGNKTGFELGLTAEIAMTEIRRIPEDYSMARIAMDFKGKKIRIRDYIPVLGNILIITLKRAEEHGKILAGRGYIRGGTHRPEFVTEKNDWLALFFSIMIVFIVFLPLVRYL